MNPIAETRVPILLDKERELIFDMNTLVAYESETGKFFLDTMASLYEAMRPALEAQKQAMETTESGEEKTLNVRPMDILRKVPMRDLRALIWAAVHEYDKDDNPSWPLTINQVGRILQISDIPRVFTGFLKGQTKNSPTVAEMGESPVPAKVRPNGSAAHLKTDIESGGVRSTALPEDAFD